MIEKNRKKILLLTSSSPLDTLAIFETASQSGGPAGIQSRYAVRQALDQEYQKFVIRQSTDMRQARYNAGALPSGRAEGSSGAVSRPNETTSKPIAAKRDFFGRIISDATTTLNGEIQSNRVARRLKATLDAKTEREIWVSFHEGFSNAVRKPITLEELMRGF